MSVHERLSVDMPSDQVSTNSAVHVRCVSTVLKQCVLMIPTSRQQHCVALSHNLP